MEAPNADDLEMIEAEQIEETIPVKEEAIHIVARRDYAEDFYESTYSYKGGSLKGVRLG